MVGTEVMTAELEVVAYAPVTDALVADDDPTRRQDQLNISQAQAKAVIEPDRMLDDRGREAEAAIRVR